MFTLQELRTQAMQLPENQSAVLAAPLLESLPAVLHDEDSGAGEALLKGADPRLSWERAFGAAKK